MTDLFVAYSMVQEGGIECMLSIVNEYFKWTQGKHTKIRVLLSHFY